MMNVSIPSRVQSLPGIGAVFAQDFSQWALGIILLVHVVATCVLMPPGELLREDPVLIVDHSVHTHRIQLYRDSLFSSGWPWGYDPRSGAGFVMSPGTDVGAKPQEVLGVLLFFLEPGTIERVFVFLVVLTIPLWVWLACRRIGLPLEAQLWVLVALLIPAWLYDNLPRFVIWGMVAFAASSYFLPYVLTLFLDFITRPNLKAYLFFCLGGALLFLLHVLGPVILVLPLVMLSFLGAPLSMRWRLATLASPLVIFSLNAFWAVPFLTAFLGMPSPPVPIDLDLTLMPHMAKPHLTYENFSEILSLFTPLRVMVLVGGLGCVMFGLVEMSKMVGRRITLAFGLAGAAGLGLKIFGSFIPGVVLMQPARFILPTFVLLSIPIGIALYKIVEKMHVPTVGASLVVTLCAVIGATILDKPKSFASFPNPSMALVDFVDTQTQSSDRLLIQSMAWEPRVLHLLLDREVVGNSFPFPLDPSQFLPNMLWGKSIAEWSPREMGAILQRWGISWCFTHNKQGRALFENITNSPGEQVGKYRAFQIPRSEGRFLVGDGQIHATVNHIRNTVERANATRNQPLRKNLCTMDLLTPIFNTHFPNPPQEGEQPGPGRGDRRIAGSKIKGETLNGKR